MTIRFSTIQISIILALLLTLLPLQSFADTTSIGIAVTSSLKSTVVEALHTATSIVKPKPTFEVELGKLKLLGDKGPITTRVTDKAKGKKVVLYFWSIYCRDCVDKIQELQKLKAEFSKQNTMLIPIHLFESNEETLSSTLAKLGVSLPVYLAPESIRQLFSINLLPSALVLDESKEMVARFDGELNEERLEVKLMDTISETIKKP